MFAIATTRARLQTMRLGISRRRQQNGRRTIDDAGRIAGVVHEVDIEIGIFVENEVTIGRALVVERIVCDRGEGRLQSGKAFERGLRPRILLAIQRKAAVLAVNRHQAPVEMAALDRGSRALLAFQTQRIDIPSGNALERRHRIGADALMRLRVPGAQTKIAIVHHERPLSPTAFHRHHLGAAGDHEIFGTRHDGVGGHVDAGDPGPAEPVQRDAARTHIISGIERRHAAEIAALRAALRTGAPDDVVNVSGIDSGTVGQRPQHGCTELLRMNAGQRTLAGLANASRRPACVDNQCVNHCAFLGDC